MNLRNLMLARVVSAGIVVGTAIAGPVLLAGGASAGELAKGGSICGTVWHDANEDGYRQVYEAGIPFQLMSIEGQQRYTISGPDGRYCLTGLPVGEYVVKSHDRARLDQTSWTWDRPGGSRFYPVTGLGHDTDGMNTFPVKITEENGEYTHFENLDSGFLTARNDRQAVQVLVNWGGGPQGPYKIGDVVEILGSVNTSGNASDRLGATLTVPEGLTILQTVGATPSRIEGQQVIADSPGRLYRGNGLSVAAKVRVDKPMTDAEIKIEVHRGIYKDINPDNNVLTGKITTVGS